MSDFHASVCQQIEKLRSRSFREIEASVSEKRMGWWRDRLPEKGKSFTPRDAFETLFFDYMGLTAADLPVVSESKDMIVWKSMNPCPTLDACAELKLDTRIVCRAAYEKSTQAFISQMDPQLRFLRSYQEIRPYADYCLESIVRVDFARVMDLAIEEARQSSSIGMLCRGAVIVEGERILAKAHDTGEVQDDLMLHAEALALNRAIQVKGENNLCGSILFTTCEPCPACYRLAIQSNLTSIVFGVSNAESALSGRAITELQSREKSEWSAGIEVIGGIHKEVCVKL